jgi:hypothetical protein
MNVSGRSAGVADFTIWGGRVDRLLCLSGLKSLIVVVMDVLGWAAGGWLGWLVGVGHG